MNPDCNQAFRPADASDRLDLRLDGTAPSLLLKPTRLLPGGYKRDSTSLEQVFLRFLAFRSDADWRLHWNDRAKPQKGLGSCRVWAIERTDQLHLSRFCRHFEAGCRVLRAIRNTLFPILRRY